MLRQMREAAPRAQFFDGSLRGKVTARAPQSAARAVTSDRFLIGMSRSFRAGLAVNHSCRGATVESTFSPVYVLLHV